MSTSLDETGNYGPPESFALRCFGGGIMSSPGTPGTRVYFPQTLASRKIGLETFGVAMTEMAAVHGLGGAQPGFLAFETEMPTISVFYGIVIQMFWNEHAPPHFHALYGEYEALIDIRGFEVLRGRLPRRALKLVLEWAELHQSELMEDWELCSKLQTPKPIDPLE